MNQKENGELKKIAKHVAVLNEEVGDLKDDFSLIKNDVSLIKNNICWIRKLGYFLCTIVTIGVGKTVFFG